MSGFKDVPVGTKCFVTTRNGWYTTVITRYTKTMVFTKSSKQKAETKWNIENGSQIGTDRWTNNVLQVFNDTHQEIVDKHILIRRLHSTLDKLKDKAEGLTQEDLDLLNTML